MNRIMKVTRLHMNKIGIFVVVPAVIVALVMVISIVIALAIQRATGMVGSADYIAGARQNGGLVWSLPGFLVYYGVQAVATTYPFALTLGTTRRNFVLGTMLANVLQAAYIALLLVALLGVELATDHWFMSVYVLDVTLLGAGDPWVLGVTAFLGVLCCLTIGGFFGAIWVRFGAKGPAIVGSAIGLVLAVLLLVFAPQLPEILGGITRAGLAVGALAAIALALIVTWFAMRRAAVR
ncbi:hypothetical protein [Leucobacter chromiiresistens]|uniref:Uncharacterized protein n=1 Tax=Leucobacter chromiiresistens TaxID=1079994 RepID=A0A1H0YES1_9MICO|nr:hypothetical protein [Leucobacter chromiiresistens]SDQ13471.1 hypothetical protein SAMN04488565_0792 [Leucobacter chromiiresistens]